MSTDTDSQDGQDQEEEKSQQQYLQDAKRAVNRGHRAYARQVMFVWFDMVGLDQPFLVNQDPDSQVDYCQDCSTGTDPVEAEFFWTRWGSLCSWCSLARFDNDGENPRIGDNAEQRAQVT